MSAEVSATVPKSSVKYFRSPQTVIGRFVAKRTIYSAVLWALVFGAYVASKASGYANLYPTLQDRLKFLASFSSNIGINAILGLPHNVETVAGFTAWNCLMILTIIGSIWAFLLATKKFRGEEEAGRWELLLSGQTTARRATVNVLAGLSMCLAVFFGVTAITFIATGRLHNVDFNTSAALFFALAATAGAAMFIAIGTFISQLMPTRSRAAGVSAAIFGIFFLLRAAADITSLHWLLNLSPLGWIEKLQPLFGSRWVWFIPIIVLVLILSILTVWIAGERDLGASIFADKDTAKAHTRFLNGPLAMSIRLTWAKTLSWALGLGIFSFFFGILTKSAAQAISASANEGKYIDRLVHAQQLSLATTFIGVIFFILMPLIMAYVASAVGAMRNDEAEGYLDNLLVRPVSRLRWLYDRISLIIMAVLIVGIFSAICSWAGAAIQHNGIAFHSYITAGINAIVPAIFTLGIGIFALGFMPRLTTIIAYSVVAWSFLISMISSGIKLNHWVLDTSIMTHMNLAPAVSPNWTSALVIILLGIAVALLGILRFNRRDLASE